MAEVEVTEGWKLSGKVDVVVSEDWNLLGRVY